MATGSCSATNGASIREQHDYAVAGVKLKFPCKAYPSQVAMMHKVCVTHTIITRTRGTLHGMIMQEVLTTTYQT